MSNEIHRSWARWIDASVINFLRTELRTLLGESFLVFKEGELEVDHSQNQEWVECRLDGPIFGPVPEEYNFAIEINLLVISLQREENIYRHTDVVGACQKVLSKGIEIKKYGDGEASLCWVRLKSVFTSNFGKIDPDTSMVQSTVEVRGFSEVQGV